MTNYSAYYSVYCSATMKCKMLQALRFPDSGRKALQRKALLEKSPTLFDDCGEKPYTSSLDRGEKPYTSFSDRGAKPYI